MLVSQLSCPRSTFYQRFKSPWDSHGGISKGTRMRGMKCHFPPLLMGDPPILPHLLPPVLDSVQAPECLLVSWGRGSRRNGLAQTITCSCLQFPPGSPTRQYVPMCIWYIMHFLSSLSGLKIWASLTVSDFFTAHALSPIICGMLFLHDGLVV